MSCYLVVCCIFLSINVFSCVINAALVCIILVRIKRALSKACHIKFIWFSMGHPHIVLFKSHSGSNAKLLTSLPLAADMDKVRRSERTKQASAMLDPEEVYVEKLRAVRNSRAGQLSAVSRVSGSIETLMDKMENVATVSERLSEYNEMCNRFTDVHNAFMTVAKDDSEDQIDALRQYDRLVQERDTFRKVVNSYLQNAAKSFSQQVMKYFVSREAPVGTMREGSITSRSTASESRKAEAMRAQLALQLAEQERQK